MAVRYTLDARGSVERATALNNPGCGLGPAAPDVVQRANSALRAALADKDTVDGLALMGLESRSSTPAELAAMLKADTERWGPIVKSIGFTADS